MKCYLINLDRCPERLSASKAELDAAGISFERLQAIDGRSLSPKLVKQECSRLGFFLANGRRIKLNELACALSHHACYRAGIASNSPYFAVFEDDLLVDGAAFGQAQTLIERENDPSRPMLWLLNHRNCVPDPGCQSSVRLLDTHGDVMHTWGAEGYVVNLAAARLLLDFASPIRYVADAWPTFARHGIDVRVVFPTACAIRDTPSIIARPSGGRASWRWYQKFGWLKYRVAFWLDIIHWRLFRPRRFR